MFEDGEMLRESAGEKKGTRRKQEMEHKRCHDGREGSSGQQFDEIQQCDRLKQDIREHTKGIWERWLTWPGLELSHTMMSWSEGM